MTLTSNKPPQNATPSTVILPPRNKEYLARKGTQRVNQRIQLDWWTGQIGCHLLADVTPAMLAECRDRLANEDSPRGGKYSPSTINRYIAALSHVYTVAVREWGWVDDSPLRKVGDCVAIFSDTFWDIQVSKRS